MCYHSILDSTSFLFMNLNIICWNCRGAASKHFHRICKDLCREYKADILIILEPRCSGDKATKLVERMGFNSSWRMEAEGYSGGIWILWNSGNFKVFDVEEMKQCVTIRLVMGNRAFFLSCIYGSPNMKGREELWAHLWDLADNLQNEYWACIGDFNSYLSDGEKLGGGRPNWTSMKQFNSCIEVCGLCDIGFSGPIHTWTNGRTKERLDRCLVNHAWDQEVLDTKLWHLNQLKSDHRPLLLKVKDPNLVNSRIKPSFRFQSAWLTNESFKDVVKAAWLGDTD